MNHGGGAHCGAGHWFGGYIWYTKYECFMSYCRYEYMILILVLLENGVGRKGYAWWRTLSADGNKTLTPTMLLSYYLSFGLDKSFGVKFCNPVGCGSFCNLPPARKLFIFVRQVSCWIDMSKILRSTLWLQMCYSYSSPYNNNRTFVRYWNIQAE